MVIPSSTEPLQLSSAPLQVSEAAGLMAALVSSQSVLSAIYPAGWVQEDCVLFGSPKPSLSVSAYQITGVQVGCKTVVITSSQLVVVAPVKLTHALLVTTTAS